MQGGTKLNMPAQQDRSGTGKTGRLDDDVRRRQVKDGEKRMCESGVDG